MASDLLPDLFEDNPLRDLDTSALLHSRLILDTDTAEVDHEAGTATRTVSLSERLSAEVASNQAGAVIAKIEKIFDSILDSIVNEKNTLAIPLKVRPRSRACREEESTEGSTKTGVRNVTFPNKNTKEAWKFTVLFRILELSHDALVTGIVTTKRDIYYRDPELFMRQQVVDRYVDDIAYTFGVDRQALNVVAAAKGLVAGDFTATRKDESAIDFTTESEGILVPNSRNIETIQLSKVHWVLVIEKEATFRTIATSRYWKDSLAGSGIITTAKGYPDIQTRRFLHFLSTKRPSIPIFALVDYDPDGLGIMSTYKHGSIALAHERDVAVPSIKWLGVRSSDFLKTETDVLGLLTLTKRDRRIAEKMLGRQKGVESEDLDWRRELQVMLTLNVKAEIQILGNGQKLGNWLDEKLVEGIRD